MEPEIVVIPSGPARRVAADAVADRRCVAPPIGCGLLAVAFLTSSTLPLAPDLSLYRLQATMPANSVQEGSGYGQRYDLAVPSEIDLVAQANFASGSALATGAIQCTKVLGAS